MAYDPHQLAPLFRMEVTADSRVTESVGGDQQDLVIGLLRQLLAGQQRQNELLQELVQQAGATQRQRASEIGQWKQANPDLARRCRAAAEVLARVQAEFLQLLTEEVADSEEGLVEGEFVLNEFIDRFGPRLAHLNGVLQVLSQLSTTPTAASSS